MSTARTPFVFGEMSVSADGFASGVEHLGLGALAILDWQHRTSAFCERVGVPGGADGPDSDIVRAKFDRTGAYVMGRTMFDTGEANWANARRRSVPRCSWSRTEASAPRLSDTTSPSSPTAAEALSAAPRQAAGDGHVQVPGAPCCCSS